MRVLEVDATGSFQVGFRGEGLPRSDGMVKNSRLCGQGIITYLTEKGYLRSHCTSSG